MTSWPLKYLPILLPFILCGCLAQSNPPVAEPLRDQLPQEWTAATADSRKPRPLLNGFADPKLAQLIQEGLLNNYNLQTAAARVKATWARAEMANADRFPSASLDLDAARTKTRNGKLTTTTDSYQLTAAVRWEVDLWQRLSLTEQAASQEAAASEADQHAARLSLAAGIARSWFQLSEAGMQAQLAGQIADSYRQSQQVVEEQYRSGLTSALDLRLARTALQDAEVNRHERERLVSVIQRNLEQLLGRYPAGQIEAAAELPTLTEPVPVGLPSTLLERRPDLLAAGSRLEAAGLRSKAAQRNLLPTLLLTTSAGTVSDRFYQLFDWDYLILNLAGNLSQTLFDGGRKSAERQIASAQQEEQLASYAETALTAFREVEVALTGEISLQRQELALQQANIEADEARLLAEQRYRQGLEGIVTLLEAQRRSFVSRSDLLRIHRRRLENRIDLQLALGGPLPQPDNLPQTPERP